MATESVYDLEQRAALLSTEDQLYLAERILARVRNAHFTDHEAAARELAAWEQWHLGKLRPAAPVEENTREAG